MPRLYRYFYFILHIQATVGSKSGFRVYVPNLMNHDCFQQHVYRNFNKHSETLNIRTADPVLEYLCGFKNQEIPIKQGAETHVENSSENNFDNESGIMKVHSPPSAGFEPMEALDMSDIKDESSESCVEFQATEQLENLSQLMYQIRVGMDGDLQTVIPSSYCINPCKECDCTRADLKLIVAYKLPTGISSGLISKKEILDLVNDVRDVIQEKGLDYFYRTTFDPKKFGFECILEFVNKLKSELVLSEEGVKFFKAVKKLQRMRVLVNLYSEFLDAASEFFDLSNLDKVVVLYGNPTFPYKLCKRETQSFFAGSSLIGMKYLPHLHMEILELPVYAYRDIIANKLRSMKTVAGVENDESFECEKDVVRPADLKNVSTVFPGSKALMRKRRKMHSENLTILSSESEVTQHPLLRQDYNYTNVANKVISREKRAPVIPNDPLFGLQWALGSSTIASLRLVDAWPEISILEDLEPMTVAVIDSGIHGEHEDLKDSLWVNKDEIPSNGIDDDLNGYIDDINGWVSSLVLSEQNTLSIDNIIFSFIDNTPHYDDENGHGTQVSGIIAAISNNSRGITPVCSFCKIMVLKTACVHADGKCLSSKISVIEALEYALKKEVKISNYSSFGRSSYLFRMAIRRSAQKNMLLIMSSGNSKQDLDSVINKSFALTFRLPNVVSVAALDMMGSLASFSNYGLVSVTVGAPGEDIWTTDLANQYDQLSGTSYATPYATGIVALIRALNPELNHRLIKEKLKNLGIPLPSLTETTSSGKGVSFYNVFRQYFLRESLRHIHDNLSEGESSQATPFPRDELK